MQTTDIQNILAELTQSIGETPKDILPIAESGSARKYFRIITDSKSLIGTYSSNIEENEAFLTFSKHFHERSLPSTKKRPVICKATLGMTICLRMCRRH